MASEAFSCGDIIEAEKINRSALTMNDGNCSETEGTTTNNRSTLTPSDSCSRRLNTRAKHRGSPRDSSLNQNDNTACILKHRHGVRQKHQ